MSKSIMQSTDECYLCRMNEVKIQEELERLRWLRKAVYMMPPCKNSDETSIKVTNLTILGGQIAKLERELYECQHPDADN